MENKIIIIIINFFSNIKNNWSKSKSWVGIVPVSLFEPRDLSWIFLKKKKKKKKKT